MLSHPFDARNQCALIMKIVQAQMAPISPHVPPELRELVLWILQKDPKDRPKTKEILCDVSSKVTVSKPVGEVLIFISMLEELLLFSVLTRVLLLFAVTENCKGENVRAWIRSARCSCKC
jgi:serine/threonine protein kinase